MTNKEKFINEVFGIDDEMLAQMLSNDRHKCEFCIKIRNGNCKVDDCKDAIKQWLKSEYKENKKIYKIEDLIKK